MVPTLPIDFVPPKKTGKVECMFSELIAVAGLVSGNSVGGSSGPVSVFGVGGRTELVRQPTYALHKNTELASAAAFRKGLVLSMTAASCTSMPREV